MSPDGPFSWRDRSVSGAHTEADVRRMALQVCEWYGGACVLYAVDDAVAAPLPSGLPPFHPPMLVRAGPLDTASVPFLPGDPRGSGERRVGKEGRSPGAPAPLKKKKELTASA